MAGGERPLLFRSEMVRALMEGRKTQTRRPAWRAVDDGLALVPTAAQRIKVGDLVWVKENWRVGPGYNHWPPRDVTALATVWYEATGEPSPRLGTPIGFAGRLRPSIHMPRWVSRLTLVVTDVRVQPLQDISEADATAEGVTIFDPASVNPIARPFAFDLPNSDRATGSTARRAYEVLWRTIHGDAAWHTNPEVVAITFTVHKQNIDAFTATRAAA